MNIKCQITVLDSILKNQYDLIIKKIALMSIKYYNYFENLSNEFSMSVKYNKNKLIVMTFENGSYNVSDINQIVDDTIQQKFNITETPITITAVLIDFLY